MYESADINKYLFNTYGPGEKEIPLLLTGGKFATMLSMLGMNAPSMDDISLILIYLFHQ